MKISSIRVRHFKAVQDSGPIKLGPLTAFVGYNGTGKSSLIEAAEFFQTYALQGLDAAVQPWFGFEHILWQGAERKRPGREMFYSRPLQIELTGRMETPKTTWKANLTVAEGLVVTRNQMVTAVGVKREFLKVGAKEQSFDPSSPPRDRPRPASQLFDLEWAPDFRRWMFLSLNPHEIGQPRRRPESKGDEPLSKTGANLADVLKSFLAADQGAFDAMVEALQYILPYAANINPEVTKDMVETRSLIRMTEAFASGHAGPSLPGWVLSGGTLRILALLAALRHPQGPSVLFIEELENGLDPRAIGFVIEEIRKAVSSGEKQVILTTHSPYLLNKLSLKQIVTVEREKGGPPVFRRPDEEAELNKWAEDFAPGSLYTMGMLRGKEERVK
jgi:predicted ATPase